MTLLPLNVGAPAAAVPSVIVAVAALMGLSNVNTIVCAGPCRGSVAGLVVTVDSGKSNVPAPPCTLRDTALWNTGAAAVVPLNENAALKVGGVLPPTISVPMRSQSGSRFAFRIQL